MTEKEYRAYPAISRSQLWRIRESPEKFRYYEDNPQPPTPALLFGQVVHKLLLQPEDFESEFVVRPDFDRRTKAKSKPNVKDYISVLNGNDFLRHSNLFTQFWSFMSWLLKEEPPKFDEDDETMWYSLSFLAEKWNEFARIENERINGKEATNV